MLLPFHCIRISTIKSHISLLSRSPTLTYNWFWSFGSEKLIVNWRSHHITSWLDTWHILINPIKVILEWCALWRPTRNVYRLLWKYLRLTFSPFIINACFGLFWIKLQRQIYFLTHFSNGFRRHCNSAGTFTGFLSLSFWWMQVQRFTMFFFNGWKANYRILYL